MAWSLKGSYAETCSCELMCPCNLSFDHGATYDYCRATLAFHVREGEIDGTDVAGLNAVVIIDTPKVMTDGNWRLGMFIDEQASDEQADKLARSSAGSSAVRWPGLAPLVGEVLGVERARIELDRRRATPRRARRRRDRLRDRGHRAVRRRAGAPVRFAGMFHPAGSDLTMAEARRSRINAFGIEYEGKTGLSTSEFSWAA